MAPSSLSFVTLDVFTTMRYTGNPLAIVNVPASLSTLSQSQKQRIAREFNLSETVFLHEQTDSDTASSSVRIDIFTAHAEVPFAGHPTVGTANYLLRMLQNDSNPALNQVKALQAKAGRFGITLDQAVNGTRIAVPHDVHIHADHPFADRPFFDRYQSPVVSIVKGMTFILARLPDLEVLAWQTKNLLGPENTYTSQYALDQGWRTGIVATYVSPLYGQLLLLLLVLRCPDNCAMTKFFVDLGMIDNSTQTQTRDLRTRMFGSREDPATGSAASALASYLALQTGRAGRYEYRLTQGVEMGQNSQIAVEVSVKLATATTENGANDKVEVEEVLLSGSAVLTMRGTLEIPDDEG
jgi:predicted PhzF superfamily epimerase YddE/YHI9